MPSGYRPTGLRPGAPRTRWSISTPNPNPSPNPSPNPNPNPNPNQLDISWCRGVSDDGAGLLADACSQLHTLTIWGCSQLTQRFLHGHSNQQLRIVGRGPTQ